MITIIDDGRGEDAETIILSTMFASGDATLTSRPLVLTIPVDPPLPTVNLSSDNTSITEGNMATITLTLSEILEEDATFNLISGGTEPTRRYELVCRRLSARSIKFFGVDRWQGETYLDAPRLA